MAWSSDILVASQHVNSFGDYSRFYLDTYYSYNRDGDTVYYKLKLNFYYMNTYKYGGSGTYGWNIGATTKFNGSGESSYQYFTSGGTWSSGANQKTKIGTTKEYSYSITNTTGTGTVQCGVYVNNTDKWSFDNPGWYYYNLAIPPLNTATLDLNGQLDGTNTGSIEGYGTVNVTVGGVNKGQGVADYYASHTINSSYVIDAITPLKGHTYNGPASGSDALSGTLNGNKNVRLSFTTNTYTIYYDANGGTYSGSSTSYKYNASGTVSLSSTLPTKSYASFSGWRYENTTYPAGGSFPANKAMDVTVVAVWSPVVPTNIKVNCLTRTVNSLAMQVTYNAIEVTNIKLYYKRSQDDNYNYVEIDPTVNMVILNNLDMDTNYDFYAEVTNAAGTGSSLD